MFVFFFSASLEFNDDLDVRTLNLLALSFKN